MGNSLICTYAAFFKLSDTVNILVSEITYFLYFLIERELAKIMRCIGSGARYHTIYYFSGVIYVFDAVLWFYPSCFSVNGRHNFLILFWLRSFCTLWCVSWLSSVINICCVMIKIFLMPYSHITSFLKELNEANLCLGNLYFLSRLQISYTWVKGVSR